MSESRINVRIDKELKEEADKVYKEMGMNLSTAITVFLKQSVNDQSMPFKPNLNNAANIQARKEVESGETEQFDNVEDWWMDLNED
ncbi:type II toxin-antitoxin system RelB/DinJ family antitoxin [Alkalibacterium thalassium]|jgi:DNA-damage-inducible protein J|uniref:DNA-damage-inducible protein J n=1 Tax=Alkalibacterium thalassium TaxID=426701 RepID=A0A1G9E300_9LACT|nr:type II toxin-antitoxin system RelB/DinJ family antitoxin [Alkalibacterium thalassium]SDK70460.1 DNA-damage-inducible protein J [Alkalibacterium thalassium]